MANEAVILIEREPAVSRNCANGTGIEKGTILKLTDPNTVAASSADNDVFGGICKDEKIASDGRTVVAVSERGEAKMTIAAGNTTTVGQDVVIKGANQIGGYTTLDDEKGYRVGKALETGAAGETVRVAYSVT